jgi:hypothetical protein
MGTKVFFPANFHHCATQKKEGVGDLLKRTFFSWEKWAEVTIVNQGICFLKSQDLDLTGL